jgi:endonuclease/exonuclease/phosphatase family metal-dependent hydrolase
MYLLNRIFFPLNIVAILILLCSYLAPYVNPDAAWYFAFAGMAYPVLLLVNIFFFLYWGFQIRMKALYSLVAILLGYSHLSGYFQTDPQKAKVISRTIKIMSFNTHNFGAPENKHSACYSFSEIMKEDKPDVFCLQESYESNSFKGYNLKKELKDYNLAFVRIEDNKLLGKGLPMMSRFPIVNQGLIIYDSNSTNFSAFIDVVVKGKDTIRVINTHLESIRFERYDYNFVNNVSIGTDTDVVSTKNILRKLKTGFIKRAVQVDQLEEFIERSPYRIILCGDFNDTPVSYAYSKLSEGMKDAFKESGSGLGTTYTGPFPSYRIDYILFDSKFDAFNYKSVETKYSDHKIIKTLLDLNSE